MYRKKSSDAQIANITLLPHLCSLKIAAPAASVHCKLIYTTQNSADICAWTTSPNHQFIASSSSQPGIANPASICSSPHFTTAKLSPLGMETEIWQVVLTTLNGFSAKWWPFWSFWLLTCHLHASLRPFPSSIFLLLWHIAFDDPYLWPDVNTHYVYIWDAPTCVWHYLNSLAWPSLQPLKDVEAYKWLRLSTQTYDFEKKNSDDNWCVERNLHSFQNIIKFL